MLIALRRSSVDLCLTTPLDFCCSCGAQTQLRLIDTPLKKTSYSASPWLFLFAIGGEVVTYQESFPYCPRCAGSAKRMRTGWLDRLIKFCLALAVVFVLMIMAAPYLPNLLVANLFRSSVALVLTASLLKVYFVYRHNKNAPYYQPVTATRMVIKHSSLHHLRLKFDHAGYARIFATANAGLVASGVLKVDIQKRPPRDQHPF